MTVSNLLAPGTGNALADLAHEADHAATVQEQKEGDEYAEREFKEDATEGGSACKSNIGDRAC